jgi:hypothetical protein
MVSVEDVVMEVVRDDLGIIQVELEELEGGIKCIYIRFLIR